MMSLCGGTHIKAVPTFPLGVYYQQVPRKSALKPHCVNISLESEPPAKETPCSEHSYSSDNSDSDSDLDVYDPSSEFRQYSKSAATVGRESIPTPKVPTNRAKTAVAFCCQDDHKVISRPSSKERVHTPGWGISNRDRMRPTSISMDRSLNRHRWLHSAHCGITEGMLRMVFMTELGEIQYKPTTHDYPQIEKPDKKSLPTHLYPHSVDDVITAAQRAWAHKRGHMTIERHPQQHNNSRGDQLTSNQHPHLSGIHANRKALLEMLVFGSKTETNKKVKNFCHRRKVYTRHISDDKADQKKESLAFKKLQMVAHMTLKMIRVMSGIIANSDYKTLRSAAEQQWQILYSNTNKHKLAFNMSFFTRDRLITKMPPWAMRILQKCPDERTEQECRRVQVLLKGMRSFDKFTEKLQLSLCRAFSLDRVEEGRIILRQGHTGLNFYLVYSGSVFVNVGDVTSAGERFTKTEAVLSRGDSFGELALLKDIKRTATIAVRENCELLVVNKTVFSKVCPKIFEKELEEKEAFLRRHALFTSRWWSDSALRNLCLEAHVQEYATNQVIVTNSQYEDWIYICVEGKCDVIRCLELKSQKKYTQFSRRRSTVILADDIIDLLKSFTPSSGQEKQEVDPEVYEKKKKSIKQKLLGSMALEYNQSQNHKRSKAFIEEVEENEKKKAMWAARGSVSLTTYMKERLDKNASDIVFLNIGVLQENEVFDLSCIISPYNREHSSPLMLVSGGARVLKIQREKFYEFASEAALEHAKGIASTYERFPPDTSLLRSYKCQTNWKAYRSDLVNQVKIPGFRKYKHRTSKPGDYDKQKVPAWEYLELLKPQLGKVYQIKQTKPMAAQDKTARRTVTFGRPVFERDRNEWQPDVERIVPENIVMRRHSEVGLLRRASVVAPLTDRKLLECRQSVDAILEESDEESDESVPQINLPQDNLPQIRRKSVTIKMN